MVDSGSEKGNWSSKTVCLLEVMHVRENQMERLVVQYLCLHCATEMIPSNG